MNGLVAAPPSTSRSSWELLSRRGYFYREVGSGTLAFGISLHVTRLLFGNALLLQHLLTPALDKVFAIPMTYTVLAGLASWRRMIFRSRAHRVFSIVIHAFFLVSVPIHIATSFGASPARLTAVPMWYSLAEAAVVYPAFIVSLWRLRFSSD